MNPCTEIKQAKNFLPNFLTPRNSGMKKFRIQKFLCTSQHIKFEYLLGLLRCVPPILFCFFRPNQKKRLYSFFRPKWLRNQTFDCPGSSTPAFCSKCMVFTWLLVLLKVHTACIDYYFNVFSGVFCC